MNDNVTDDNKYRERLALALDCDDLVEAVRLARELKPWFGVAKIGLELFCAAGPDTVPAIADEGFDVFLDLKLHDIPTTVGQAARVAGELGANYLTLHAHGGAVMLRAGVDGLNEGASKGGHPEPTALAVTILTSDADAPPHILGKRVATAVEAGCAGIVCAAADVAEAKQLAPRAPTCTSRPGPPPPRRRWPTEPTSWSSDVRSPPPATGPQPRPPWLANSASALGSVSCLCPPNCLLISVRPRWRRLPQRAASEPS